jgi:hypothetical protein
MSIDLTWYSISLSPVMNTLEFFKFEYTYMYISMLSWIPNNLKSIFKFWFAGPLNQWYTKIYRTLEIFTGFSGKIGGFQKLWYLHFTFLHFYFSIYISLMFIFHISTVTCNISTFTLSECWISQLQIHYYMQGYTFDPVGLERVLWVKAIVCKELVCLRNPWRSESIYW